jgi:HD superfamily phosphohydrolase
VKLPQSERPKILNDPIYGFITIRAELLRLIDHPWFQRLRRIKQLGLTHLVYPGALNTRFHHVIGAMHLMTQAIDVLRQKGHEITDEESFGARVAILLHDIGHGPFSHTLEHSLIEGMDHEAIGAWVMDELNQQFNGSLTTGIAIFRDQHPKGFLHQLVSGQLDMDRLDYLNRDSFYTGVSEGIVGNERIIKMLEVKDDRLVVEEKGIYSIEKFLVARRLMYWQVYLHKTVVAAEMMLVEILKRAKFLVSEGQDVFAAPHFHRFLVGNAKMGDADTLADFMLLDDHDVMCAVKVWMKHPDPVLSRLSSDLIHRKTFRIQLRNMPFSDNEMIEHRQSFAQRFGIDQADAKHFVLTGKLANSAYDLKHEQIGILFKNGELEDISEASDNLNIHALSTEVEKYYLAVARN